MFRFQHAARTAAFACLALRLAAVGAAPVPVDLVMRAEVTVDARTIRLHDLLERPAAASLPDCVLQAQFGAAPLVGQVATLSRATVERQLLRAGCVAAVHWDGAQAVRVHSAGQLVEAALLQGKAEEFLRQRLAGRYAHVDLVPSAALAAVAVPKGAVAVTVRGDIPPPGQVRIPVWLDIAVDGVLYRSVVAGFDVRATQPAWIARRDLEAGATAQRDDFVLQDTPVERLKQRPIGADMPPDAIRLQRRIHAGEALTALHRPAQAAVLRGDRVKLVYGTGTVVVETAAIAMNDAQQGQALLVCALAGTAPVQARLVGAGTARLEE